MEGFEIIQATSLSVSTNIISLKFLQVLCTLDVPVSEGGSLPLKAEVTMALGESVRQEKGTPKGENQIPISLKAWSEKFAEQLVHYVRCRSSCCPDSQGI